MAEFTVIYIGAGGINFGTELVPWNHSARLEKHTLPHKVTNPSVLGNRLRVLAIVDPDTPRARAVLDKKLETSAKESYSSTFLYSDISGYCGIAPNAVFVGTPPAMRGSDIAGMDLEIKISKKFPSSALFIEKPVSSARPSLVVPLVEYFRESRTLVSVGYMLRYLKGKNFLGV
jgi:predicted dehydrogenase